MPCSSKNTSSSSRDDNDALRAFKLSESTFLASLMPKKGIAADRFVEGHSKYDARGVVVAIFGNLKISIGGFGSVWVMRNGKKFLGLFICL